jgi:hypothetical protein
MYTKFIYRTWNIRFMRNFVVAQHKKEDKPRYHRRFSQSAQNRFFLFFQWHEPQLRAAVLPVGSNGPSICACHWFRQNHLSHCHVGQSHAPCAYSPAWSTCTHQSASPSSAGPHPRMWYPILRFPNQIRISLLTRRILASFYEQFSTSVCWACRACAAS